MKRWLRRVVAIYALAALAVLALSVLETVALDGGIE